MKAQTKALKHQRPKERGPKGEEVQRDGGNENLDGLQGNYTKAGRIL